MSKNKKTALLAFVIFSSCASYAQIRINDPGRVVERQAENRANRKVDQAVDKGFDKVEEGIGNLFKKKEKKPKEETAGKTQKESQPVESSNENNTSQTNSVDPTNEESTGGKTGKPSLKSYSKFDFIPGEKIVAVEDFSQDAVGDFPSKWNTNSSGEIVTIEGTEGKWLLLGPSGVFYPEFVSKLPENFTFEFNLATTSGFSYYSGFLRTIFAQVTNAGKDFVSWQWYDGNKFKGLEVGLHPKDAGGVQGMSAFNVFAETPGQSMMKNEKSFPAFHVPEHNVVKVSIWRQKTRLRLYVDDYKVWDLPRAFNPETSYNFIGFSTHTYHDEADKYFVSNLRLAVGAPDTRSKLITEGKFSTTGILFDVNSANIKPESYGVLKEIASVLTENAAVRVQIIGHTDADGDDAANLTLSKKRSESVKEALFKDFGIVKTRLETDGKGEGVPAAPNTTAEGKASNRRVEFVKI
ncbi:OmpA family protein [Dyadobacter psychrotolerans]|uniref:OmpA family protein n=1 Tax=Dyadobacter psychrotolerans TaxID=2541721 RepID=A0A4V2Z3N8_9BACT|nr:OmpA family protein [Dyadobacter psychrotolerans]TDE13328.1 OmpA family protein [Dyadobacter psychrotolerans]